MTLLGIGAKVFDNASSSISSEVPFYSGFTNDALNWSSNVWADINGVLTLIDDIEFEITRDASTWTFNQAGIYYFHLSVNAGALSSILGFQWIDSLANTILAFGAWAGGAPDSPEMTFQGLLPVNAAEDEFTLQYCRQAGAGGIFGTMNVDGIDLATSRITIFRVGPIAA